MDALQMSEQAAEEAVVSGERGALGEREMRASGEAVLMATTEGSGSGRICTAMNLAT